MKKNTIKKDERLEDNLDQKEYLKVLVEIKKRISEAQIKSVLAANKELIRLYWEIGHIISIQQEENGWATSTVERLTRDLQKEFPGVAGFSRANLFRMKSFYSTYSIVAQAARQLEELPIFNIPWFHNVILIQKLKSVDERLWYAKQAIENGWSRSTLESYIKANLYGRSGKAITNFKRTLPDPHSMLAQQSLKDPYIFDFLTLKDDYIEKDIEQALTDNIQKFLLELGKGFAFLGRQYHISISDKDYYIDLLFYHLKLRCFVVVELKTGNFNPKDAGQINFYCTVVDDALRTPDDKPTIGLLLCKTKDDIVVEYALRNINKPIGVAGYEEEIMANIPKELKSSLPTIEEIEAELEKRDVIAETEKTSQDKLK